jgi:hypothetical protein
MSCVDLELSPRSGIELGGTKVFIGGPCYTPNNGTVCRFNKALETTAVYISPELAYCVTPPLYAVVGLIQVELSLDGGKTFNYTGTFRSSELKLYAILLTCEHQLILVRVFPLNRMKVRSCLFLQGWG